MISNEVLINGIRNGDENTVETQVTSALAEGIDPRDILKAELMGGYESCWSTFPEILGAADI